MEFSGIAFCAGDKRTINFHAIPLLSPKTLINQSSSMGIHKSEDIPFVELTGHKIGEPHHHSSFEVAKLNLTKHIGLTRKFHSFTNTSKNMRGVSFVPQKDMYGPKFPTVSLSQLVGGFVGSKSQIGSSGRESCQIWDIIFDKLVEFCGAPQSACCSIFSGRDAQSCYSFGNDLSEDMFGSFCRENVSTLDGSHTIIENTANLLQEKASATQPHPHTVSCISIPLSVRPGVSVIDCLQSGNKLCHASNVSKQSYAEVAKTFAMAQQNNHVKTRVPTMKKRRNSTQFGDMLRNNSRHFGCSVDRRYCCDSSIKDYRNEHKCAFSCRKKSQCSKVNKVVNMEQMGKTGRNSRDINVSESNFGRVKRNVPKMKQESPKTVSSESIAWKCHKKMYMDCSQVANDSTEDENLECVKSREGKFAESCIAIKCSSLTTAEIDAGHDVEGGSISVMVHVAGNLNTSPSNPESHQSSEENSVRRRCMSDCSTDSDDSFVIFESGMDSDNHFSDDDDDFVDECDDIENETGLEEVNARWQRDYSEYSNYERNPAKVQFACDTSLETVHPMVKWNYAYRAARCGPWEQMARDRERFMRRIRQSEPLLAVVFSAEHRQRVWIKCMAETSPRHNS